MEKTFTKSEVKEFVIDLLNRMMPNFREVESVSTKSDAMTLVEFGQNKAHNLDRLVYERAIKEIDLRLNEYIATKTI